MEETDEHSESTQDLPGSRLPSVNNPLARFSTVRDSVEMYKTSSSRNLNASSHSMKMKAFANSKKSLGSSVSFNKLKNYVSFQEPEELIFNEVLDQESNDYRTETCKSTFSNKSELDSVKSKPISNTRVLENIPEIDENILEEDPKYYGWDGYEARFKDSFQDKESYSLIPGCVPPWAKSFKKAYGLSSQDSDEAVDESKKTMQERIENLMKKHKDLMLVKRVENKKKMIVEPSKHPDELDAVNMRSKNTRFYVAPLTRSKPDGLNKKMSDAELSKVSITKSSDSDFSSIHKTSKTQAKKEVKTVLQSITKESQNKQCMDEHYTPREKTHTLKDMDKCPKVTLSNVREFVNMTPDERKLHQIIKIKNVASNKDLTGSKEELHPQPQYLINIPKREHRDGPTLEMIKIKEKRKLRVESIENIDERVTELHYGQGRPRKHKIGKRKDSTVDEKTSSEVDQRIKKKHKSPTETKTFEVIAKQTPIIRPLIDQDDKTEKVLLLQYDKKCRGETVPGTKTKDTQILGVKKKHDERDEMYLYGSSPDGKETADKIEDMPPTLKQKVNMIFDEIKQLTLSRPIQSDTMSESESEIGPSKPGEKLYQHVDTGVAMIQASPEVKSVEVQVRQSLLSVSRSSLVAPHSSPVDAATYTTATLDDEKLRTILEELAPESEKEDGLKSKRKTLSLIEEEEFAQLIIGIDKKDSKKIDPTTQVELSKEEAKVDIEKLKSSESKLDKIYDEDKSTKKSKESIDHGTEDTKLQSVGVDKVMESSEDPDLKLKERTQTAKKSSTLIGKGDSTKSLITTGEGKKKEPDGISAKSGLEDKMREKKEELGESTSSDFQKGVESPKKSGGSEFSLELSEKGVTYFEPEGDEDDIRSYEFLPGQKKAMKIVSSAKFFDDKNMIRKKMNWTDDTIFLENSVCPQLIKGLAEIAMLQPTDPISYLANWLYKDYENQEKQEKEEVMIEHLELTRTMMDIENTDKTKLKKKFNLRQYPVKEKLSGTTENQDEHLEESPQVVGENLNIDKSGAIEVEAM